MKIIASIVVASISIISLKSEELSISVPSDFDLNSLEKYELVWFKPKEPKSSRVNLNRKTRITINFGDFVPAEIMLYRDSQYICTLNLTNNSLMIPNVIKLTFDPTSTENGLIFVQALDGNNKFSESFFSKQSKTFFMPVDGRSIGVYYMQPSAKIPIPVKAGVFSVDFNVDYKVKVSIKKNGEGVISTSFNKSVPEK